MLPRVIGSIGSVDRAIMRTRPKDEGLFVVQGVLDLATKIGRNIIADLFEP
jgi:hypothetical protein